MVFTDDRLSGIGRNVYGGTRNLASRYFNSGMHRAGMEGLRNSFGLSSTNSLGYKMGFLNRLAGATAITGAIEGFTDDGMRGAVKGGAMGAAQHYAFRAGGALLKSYAGGLGATALAGGAVAGLYGLGLATTAWREGSTPAHALARDQVAAHTAKRAKLEMGSPLQDWTGTGVSMRQRSVNAMRESKITARSALGMEANRGYMPYFR